MSGLPADFFTREAWELADAVRAGDVKAVDLLDGYLDRIRTIDRGRTRPRSTTPWRVASIPARSRGCRSA